MFKEIMNALNQFGERIEDKMEKFDQRMDRFEKRMDKFEQRMDKLENRMDSLETEMKQGFEKINEKLDRHADILSGHRAEISELQDTTDFLLKKVASHEQKLRT